MAWLTRDGQVLATAQIAESRSERRRGLIGRSSLDGVFVLKARSVHTIGMSFPIDVAFCDSEGTVLKTVNLVPNRVSLPVWKARSAIEAPAGTFREWALQRGDRLEIR